MNNCEKLNFCSSSVQIWTHSFPVLLCGVKSGGNDETSWHLCNKIFRVVMINLYRPYILESFSCSQVFTVVHVRWSFSKVGIGFQLYNNSVLFVTNSMLALSHSKGEKNIRLWFLSEERFYVVVFLYLSRFWKIGVMSIGHVIGLIAFCRNPRVP